jgi:hypothetical protein
MTAARLSGVLLLSVIDAVHSCYVKLFSLERSWLQRSPVDAYEYQRPEILKAMPFLDLLRCNPCCASDVS